MKFEATDKGSSWRGALTLAIASLGFAFAIDQTVARWVHDVQPMQSLGVWRHVVWWMGHFAVTLGVAAVLRVAHPAGRRAAAQLLLAGVLSGILVWMIKWGVGRTRPFKGAEAFDLSPFIGGWLTLWHGRSNLAFPSGHAALAFVMAGILNQLLPRWGKWTFSLAVVVALARVLEGAHYPSDAVAGAIVGFVSAYAVMAVGRNRRDSTKMVCDSGLREGAEASAALATLVKHAV